MLVDPNYQEGTAPGEYRYTPGTPFAFAPRLGEDLTPFALEDSSQFRPGPPYCAGQSQIRRGRQRGQAPRRRRCDHSQRAHGRSDRDRPVLGRELAARVEPDRPDGRGCGGNRSLGERATVRAPEHGPDGRLHRHLGREVPLPLLATGDRDPARLQRRQPGDQRRSDVDSIAGDTADPGLRLGARCGRGSRGASPEAVLPHRPDELLGLQLHAAGGRDVR